MFYHFRCNLLSLFILPVLGFWCLALAATVIAEETKSESKAETAANTTTSEKKSENKDKSEAKGAKSEADSSKTKPEAGKIESSSTKTDKPASSEPSSPTYTVKKTPFKIVVELSGTFEAEKSYEIFVKPEEWNMLVVESAAAHGTQVRKGDVVLELNKEKIDQTIADVRAELKTTEIAVKQGEDQLLALEKLVPLDLEASKRAARIAKEDKKYFAEVDRPFALKMIDFRLKVAEQALEYEEEELRQLEKMYKADDITEETEQIVLKRARDSVERARFALEQTKLSCNEALKFTIPRVGELLEDAAQRKEVELTKNNVELPLALQKQRLELEKLRVQRERIEQRLKRLEADREAMTVKSPANGIVYYGKCVRGRFNDSLSMADNLRRNGTIMPNQIVMTIVESRPMFIRAMIPEAKLQHLRPDMKGTAAPEAFPDMKLPVTLERISNIPVGPGNFDARFNVVLNRRSKFLMPGMACNVKLTPYLKKETICVPAKCVVEDELDENKHFVFVQNKEGKPEKREVSIGEKDGKQIEITKGLSVGEKVLLDPPKNQ